MVRRLTPEFEGTQTTPSGRSETSAGKLALPSSVPIVA
jgi:hypothetical protein